MEIRKDKIIMDKFIAKVKRELLDIYGMNEAIAAKLIEDSTFFELIHEDFSYVAYYSPDYWAEEIMKRSTPA